MTRPDDTTATIERDLDAVETALTSGAATHEDQDARELQELALALRADAPEPEPAFAEQLQERVEAGFPRDPRSVRVRAPRVARRLLPAAAAVTTVVAIGVGLASIDTVDEGADGGGGGGASVAESGGGGGDDGGGSVAPAPAPNAPGAARDSARSSNLAVPPVPAQGGGGFAPGRRERKIERSISMELEAPNDDIPALASDVTEVTNRHGGFVLRSNVDSDEDGASGSFELRIPTPRLREALADLAGLATVRSQSQSGQDVTRQHVTTRDRLQSARAERRSLLRRLELAATDEEAEALRRQLDIVAGEINGLRGRLRDLHLRTDYAIVNVDLVGSDDDAGGSGAGGAFDDAVGDAGDLLVGVTGALIRILAVALPLGLIALLGWLASRSLRRRRRESVLA
jgi:Domain of unknown function (DUF4349)